MKKEVITRHCGAELMNKPSEDLTTEERKMAYVMGYDVEGLSLVERLVNFWRVFRAYRYIHANKSPLQVYLHKVNEAEQKEA
jgi:hypothetical protein